MNEDVFTRDPEDKLTERIVSRLGARQQKLEQMAAWEQTRHKAKIRPIYIISAVAACIVVVLLISPLWKTSTSPLDELGIGAPTLTEYRAASPEMTEINRLIKEENYVAALTKTEHALKNSDEMLGDLISVAEMSDDEDIWYDVELEYVANSELRWTYIYLLVRTENYKKARKELKRYLRDKDCEHRTEAEALMKKIK